MSEPEETYDDKRARKLEALLRELAARRIAGCTSCARGLYPALHNAFAARLGAAATPAESTPQVARRTAWHAP